MFHSVSFFLYAHSMDNKLSALCTISLQFAFEWRFHTHTHTSVQCNTKCKPQYCEMHSENDYAMMILPPTMSFTKRSKCEELCRAFKRSMFEPLTTSAHVLFTNLYSRSLQLQCIYTYYKLAAESENRDRAYEIVHAVLVYMNRSRVRFVYN